MDKGSLKSKVFTGMFWRFGEQISSQLVMFIVSIVLARLLEPKQYGTIAIIIVFINFANVFVTEGFGKALIQKKSANNKDFSSVFYFNIFFSWVMYFVIYLSSPTISLFYKEPILSPVMRVLALLIPISGINSIQQAYVSRNMLFKRFFLSTLLGTISSGVIGILMALNNMGIWSIVAQQISNSVANTLILWFTVKWRPSKYFSFKRMKSLLDFGWKILVTSLINSVYDNFRSLLIGKMYSSSVLAFYNRGLNYPNLLISNITTSVGSVLFPALSKIQDDKLRMKQAIRKSISVSTYLIFPMMAGLFGISHNLVSWMLTDKWLPAVPFMQIACVYLAFYPINIANLQAIIAVGRSDTFLRLNIIKKGIGFASIIISIPFGVYAMASSDIVVGILAIITNVSANKSLFNYTFKELAEDCLKNALMSIIVGIVVLMLGSVVIITQHILMVILLQITVGIILYVVMSILSNSHEFYYILEIIKKH